MHALLVVILEILSLLQYVIVILAVMSWLLAFNVINVHNEFVRMIWSGLHAVTEPVLRPIRNFLPNLGGVDISPIIVLLVLMFLRQLILDNMPAF